MRHPSLYDLRWGRIVREEARQPSCRAESVVPIHVDVAKCVTEMFGRPNVAVHTYFDEDEEALCVAILWPTGQARIVAVRGVAPTWAESTPMAQSLRAMTWGNKRASGHVRYLAPEDVQTRDVLRTIAQCSAPYRAARRAPRTIGLIVQEPHGFEILYRELPRARFIRENYAPEVEAAYTRVRSFAKGAIPPNDGRLVIIDGPPGTGKTHLLRTLVASTPATYILAAGSTVANLDNPAFLPFLLKHANEPKGLCFVIEDADDIVAHRNAGGHPGLISLLLNVTSGFLGDLLKVRVIATINTWQEERIDPAVLRPGRLFTRLSVGALNVEQARAVVAREAHELAASAVRGPMSLAECYALAKQYASKEAG